MKRSLRLRQFAFILIATLFVVFASRWTAQNRARDQFLQDLHTDIQLSLVGCAEVSGNHEAWLGCHARTFRNYLFNKLSGEVTLCHEAQVLGGRGDESSCELLNQSPDFWSGEDVSTEPAVQMVVSTLGGELWHIGRLKAHPEIRIMTSDAALQRFMHALFSVRDRQLPGLAPILILTSLLMALYVTHLTVTPLKKLKLALRNLTTENINDAERITTPFREFDGFITVYHQLLHRLDVSFTKAKRFSSDAAHELRTPLTILRGQADDLIADAPTGSPLQVRLRSMADEIERLIDISEKLFLLSKADDKQMRQDLSDVDISEVIAELADSLASAHPHLAIENDVQPGVIWHCDSSLVQQLAHNLASNAVKYNTPNGWIKLALHQDGDMLELRLENSSADVPVDLKEKAFDRFYRGDAARNRKVDGTGLGLSICKEIATLHQGTLTLDVTAAQSVITLLRAPLRPTPGA